MAILVNTPTDDDWAHLAYVDGRNFGFAYTQEMLDSRRPMIDLSRFRVARDGHEVVGVAGSFAFDVTLPGGTTVPMGGITWVSVSATHRRQGILSELMAACHDDIDQRGEPVATLYASQAPIYERFGYGIGTIWRDITIDVRGVDIATPHRVRAGASRFVEPEEAAVLMPEMWERHRRSRAGEVSRSPELWARLIDVRSKPDGAFSPAFYLRHADGYAAYRVEMRWNGGFPAHHLQLIELVALTPAAHVSLWQTLLGVDLVGTITHERFPVDDPLPYLLDDYRAVHTTNLADGVWVNVRDVAIAFGARSYDSTDRLVVEVADGSLQGKRYAIEGGPEGGACRAVRTRPDLTVPHSTLGALLYGGMRPSALAAGRRLTARTPDVLRRADLFFPTGTAPHCQTMY